MSLRTAFFNRTSPVTDFSVSAEQLEHEPKF